MKQTAMQELKWFVSDGSDNFDESVKVSEIWAKINELLEMEKQQERMYSEEDLKQAYAYNNRLNSEQSFKDWFLLFKNK